MRSKAPPLPHNACLTFSYCSQKAFILVIPRGEELQHFVLLHLSAETSGLRQQHLAHKRRMGWFRLSTPLSVISLLPRFSLQLFEETQEVCRNVHPQFAVHSPQDSVQTTTTELWCQMWTACTHARTPRHTAGGISGFSEPASVN